MDPMNDGDSRNRPSPMKNMLQSLMAEEQTWEWIKFIPRAQHTPMYEILASRLTGSE